MVSRAPESCCRHHTGGNATGIGKAFLNPLLTIVFLRGAQLLAFMIQTLIFTIIVLGLIALLERWRGRTKPATSHPSATARN